MKKKLLTLMVALLGMGGVAFADEAETISCSANLPSGCTNSGSADGINCTITWTGIDVSNHEDIDGKTYWKFSSNDKSYVQLKLNSGSFKAGDVLTVDMATQYGANSAKNVGFFLKSNNGNGNAANITNGEAQDISYTLVADDIETDGTIKIYRGGSSNTNARYYGFSVTGTRTNGEGGGESEEPEEAVETETVILSWNEEPTLSNSEGKEYSKDTNGNNVATWSNGYSITIIGNTAKDLSDGSEITVDGKKYKTIKLSNGAQNLLKLPEGKVTRKITFYSYVNEDSKSTDSYWQEVAGKTYTATDVLESYKSDTDNPDKREYTFNATNEVTFNNKGKQLCYVVFVEVEDATETIKVQEEDGYCTFTCSNALDFTNSEDFGLTAYAAVLNGDGNIEFTPITGKVPAKTGMLIKANNSGEYNIPKTFDNPTKIENVFVGVTEDTDVEEPIFILYADNTHELGFYKTTSESFNVGAKTAYIPASISYNLNRISYFAIGGDNDGTTGLNTIESEATEDGKLYDLQGRQVTNPAKGLYIKNGKKYIVK